MLSAVLLDKVHDGGQRHRLAHHRQPLCALPLAQLQEAIVVQQQLQGGATLGAEEEEGGRAVVGGSGCSAAAPAAGRGGKGIQGSVWVKWVCVGGCKKASQCSGCSMPMPYGCAWQSLRRQQQPCPHLCEGRLQHRSPCRRVAKVLAHLPVAPRRHTWANILGLCWAKGFALPTATVARLRNSEGKSSGQQGSHSSQPTIQPTC